MAKYETIVGDVIPVLEESTPVIVPHICNDIGAWGAGFTGALDVVYPEIGERFRKMHTDPNNNGLHLGDVTWATVGSHVNDVANMVAQCGVRSKSNLQPIRYAALVLCMEKVLLHARETGVVNICCPRFGSGLAGGRWEFIELLIKEIWVNRGLNVKVWILKGL